MSSSKPLRPVASLLVLVGALLSSLASAQVEAWRAAYDPSESKTETFFGFGGIPLGDQPIAVDPDGSITSLLTVGDPSRSFLTRHDASGVLLWRKEYPGSQAAAFFNGTVESDSLGNTLVLGSSAMFDSQITKFDPLGEVLWNVKPTEPISLHLLAPGPDGSAYAAGSLSFNSVPTIYVVRFSSDGTEEWRYVRADAEGTNSGVFDLAVDADGNAIIGGFFWNPEEADYLVVKIDAEGDEAWARTFDGGGVDVVRSVAVGPFGRVTVTGVSNGVNVQADYVTIQYDADGTERWSTAFTRPGSFLAAGGLIAPWVAVDSAGGAYVVGENGAPGGSPGLVVKYDEDGDESWTDTFGDVGLALQVGVDDEDHLYVAGVDTTADVSRLIVLSYEPDGVSRWVHLGSPAVFTSPAALLLHDGKALAGGTSFSEADGTQVLWLALDSADGELLWQVGHSFLGVAETHCRAPFDREGMADPLGSCLALGPDGSTHLAGYSSEKRSPDGSELRTVKLENGGDLDWTRRLTLLEGADTEIATGLATDPAGNVVTAGFPWVTVKYDAAGNEDWVRSLEDESAHARHVGVGASGAIYVSGTNFPASKQNLHLIKYDAGGNEQWSRDFEGGDGEFIQSLLVQLVTPDERVVLAGQITPGPEALARSYDADGDLFFSETFDSPGGTAWFTSLASLGDDVIAVGTARSETDYDVLVVRLEPDGGLAWRRDLDSDLEGDFDDEGRAVAVDPTSGSVYVVGRTWNGEDFDVLVIRLDSAGNQLWRRAVDFGEGDDEAWAAAFDAQGPGGSAGSLWIAGSASNDHDKDALTLRFDADGDELFRAVVAGTDQRDDDHYDLVVGPPGHATVAGRSAEIDQSYNFQAIRYVATPLDVDYDGEALPLQDGVLIVRWLFGFRDSTLESDAVDTVLCVRCEGPAIDLHLGAIRALLDVDGNGTAEPLTDGMLILRWLFGDRGEALVAGAVDPDCTRCDAESIEAHLTGLVD